MKNEFHANSRKEWRTWLSKNQSKVKEVWLVYYKKHTGKPSICYSDSVEEALCFGWIDGIKKRLDEERYTHRFTPRKTKSKWSELNVKLAKKMIAEEKMTPKGLIAFNQRINYGNKILKTRNTIEPTLPAEIEDILKQNKEAWNNFINLAPSYKKNYILWLTTVKKIETREKRLAETIKLLTENKKLGMV